MLLIVTLLTAACGDDDGRTLRPPAPDQTMTTTTTVADGGTTGPADTGTTEVALTLIGPFGPGGSIPRTFTCDGANTLPSLAWSNLPPGTAELGISVTDPDAGGFVHWVIAGIDPAAGGIGAGPLPAGAVEATNDAGSVGWFGPCPPSGETHTYDFVLYALPGPPGLSPGMPGDEAITALQDAASEVAVLKGTYTRP